jgi:hypothetical protein
MDEPIVILISREYILNILDDGITFIGLDFGESLAR